VPIARSGTRVDQCRNVWLGEDAARNVHENVEHCQQVVIEPTACCHSGKGKGRKDKGKGKG